MSVLIRDTERLLGINGMIYTIAVASIINVAIAVNNNGANVPVSVGFMDEDGNVSASYTVSPYNVQKYRLVQAIGIVVQGDGANISIVATTYPEDADVQISSVEATAVSKGGPASLVDVSGVPIPLIDGAVIVGSPPAIPVLGRDAGGTVRMFLVDGTGRLLVVLAAGSVVDVSDRAGRLVGTVSPVAGSVWDVSDRSGRLLGTVSPVAGSLWDVSDRIARLLGVIRGEQADNAANPTTKVPVLSARANAAEPAWTEGNVNPLSVDLEGGLRVKDAKSSDLGITAVGAVNTAVTATLPAPAANRFHHITHIKLTKGYSVVGIAAGAGVTITSTNLPGGPAWSTEQLALAAGSRVQVIWEEPTTPIKSSVAATATTFVAPAQLQTIWRWNIRYFVGP